MGQHGVTLLLAGLWIIITANGQEGGVFPDIFNLASEADILVNATCGEYGPETFCKLVEHVRRDPMNYLQCGVCNANGDEYERHPINLAIDGSNRWWQSPSLANGWRYNYVTITLDLGQVYQVAYVIVKAANSPRPGSWVLERSLDGITYTPWQYYAVSDSECWTAYGTPPTVGKPRFTKDDQVICSSYYSKLDPLENGEIHTSLVNDRPGSKNGPTRELLDFTSARFVRLRFQKIRTLNADLMTIRTSDPDLLDKSVTRRYFYSIKDISVGGTCICYGHAGSCPRDPNTRKLTCQCQDNTCGDSCQRCCPMFNQKPWQPSTELERFVCEECECYGHASSCVYNETVAGLRQSINKLGQKEGGGVCLNCTDYTTGVNCEQCVDGYFREGSDKRQPCRPCQCRMLGSTGTCVKDNSRTDEGLRAGDCICRTGFTGPDCDRCAPGFRNYPSCEPCPCNRAGSTNMDTCEGECQCKPNVMGERCDQCKPGFYNLDQNNPLGCSECFCFGLSRQCRSVEWGKETISSTEGWRVTDVIGKKVVVPKVNNGRLSFETDDTVVARLSDVFYWQAPPLYSGMKLTAYGGVLKYTFQYDLERSGDPELGRAYTADVDIILEGIGDLVAGTGGQYYREGQDETRSVNLTEQNWYYYDRETGLLGAVYNKQDFLSLLSNIQRILIRASYHKEQSRAELVDITLTVAEHNSLSPERMPMVEQCVCPVGYYGLSCERCEKGYRRVNNVLYGGICQRCDCNNHADSCDAYTGMCKNCLHNTVGFHCENCEFGYYGNATYGTPTDCTQCACPLRIPSNNFAKTCQPLTPGVIGGDYYCTDCAEGYVGNHCEMCADGFYGSPETPGSYCQRCACSGNVDPAAVGNCNRVTGQCLKCLYNTEGFNCERCIPGYYGMEYGSGCRDCECNRYGSTDAVCDAQTGQCECRPNYTGRTCDQCVVGYGNIVDGCQPCNCASTGSFSDVCDQVSGQCRCKPGVGGLTCAECMVYHYGYSDTGCTACGCHLKGSNSSQCDSVTGDCDCLPNVDGKTCDSCLENHWGLDSGKGCTACDCDKMGSTSMQCDSSTGQCTCKPGVGGQRCDECIPGYYGFSPAGCIECQVCPLPGQVCDPVSGVCVCPPNTEGDMCERCSPGAWNYDPYRGCKLCNCNTTGSESSQCNVTTGQCPCRTAYSGDKCDRCQFGHYDFPACLPCGCNTDGTVMSACNFEGQCQCNETGQCPCKENVIGEKCSSCAEDTFSLQSNNPQGCTPCFCFGKSTRCTQAPLAWGEVTMPARYVTVTPNASAVITNIPGFHLIPPDVRTISFDLALGQQGLPYWSLPKEFVGDKVLSYYGKLRFTILFDNNLNVPDTNSRLVERDNFPLVRMTGNFRVTLDYYAPLTAGVANTYEVLLREDEWTDPQNPDKPVTREMMMVALQNLQTIYIRASKHTNIRYAEIKDVSMQTAVEEGNGNLALGVERCECPLQYTGSSCQNPSDGYFRFFPGNNLEKPTRLIDLVGVSERCKCYNHSFMCDKETGVCSDCAHYTTGDHCQKCASGYYGDPTTGQVDACKQCACPLTVESNNPTCVLTPDGDDYVCESCPAGYTGDHCESCSDFYFGDPTKPGSQCSPCECSRMGSISDVCDKTTGQCQCFEGIIGRTCDQCRPRYAVVNGRCKSCDEGCTRELMIDVDRLQTMISNVNFTTNIIIPWERFEVIENTTRDLRTLLVAAQLADITGLQAEVNKTKPVMLKILQQSEEVENNAASNVQQITNVKDAATDVKQQIMDILMQTKDLLEELPEKIQKLTGYFNVTAAVIRANKILQDIKDRDFDPDWDAAQEELRLALELRNNITELLGDQKNITALKERLVDISNRLNDLTSLSSDSAKDSRQALSENQKNEERIAALRDLIQQAEANITDVQATLQMANTTLNEARIVNNNFTAYYFTKIKDDLDTLTKQTEAAAVKGGLIKQNLPRLQPLVGNAVEHAERLTQQAKDLEEQFQPAKVGAEDAVKAAKVYESIVTAMAEAKQEAEAAQSKAQEALDRSVSADNSTLQEYALRSANTSRRFKQEATRLRKKGEEVKSQFDGVKEDLSFATNTTTEAEKLLQELNAGIDGLPKDIGSRANAANMKAMDAITKEEVTSKKIQEIGEGIGSNLYPKLDILKAATPQWDIGNASKSLDEANTNLENIRQSSTKIDTSLDAIKRLNTDLSQNLMDLKDSIKRARQQANNIKLSMSSNGNCFRSYKPAVQSSTTNTISLSFKTNTTNKDMLLFYLHSEAQLDYMALDIVEGKVRFLWNSGGGFGKVEHSLLVEDESVFDEEADKWYTITAQRTANSGTLSVQKISSAAGADPNLAQASSSSENAKLNVDATSKLYIAGVPQTVVLPPEMQSRTFIGCLADVMLDSKPVGLWNFATTEGQCSGCTDSPTPPPPQNIYQFDGTGYAEMPQVRRYDENLFSISFEFKTFWEDALLFMSANNDNGDFIVVELKAGYVVFTVNQGAGTNLTIQTTKQYNTNKWVKVSAGREGFKGKLDVDRESITMTTSGTETALDLEGSSLFFGGVPTRYSLDGIKEIKKTPFVGCLREVSITSPSSVVQNLFDGNNLGMQPGCRQNITRLVGFRGDGFVKLSGDALGKDGDVSFAFQTLQPDALLAFAKEDDASYYTISLIGGNIEVRANAGEGEAVLKTNGTKYNDAKMHGVAIKKNRRRLTLLIDDNEAGSTRLPKGITRIEVLPDTGLFMGGVPDGVNVGTSASTSQALQGCIRDVVLNGKLQFFDNPLEFYRADVGRCPKESLELLVPSTTTTASTTPEVTTEVTSPSTPSSTTTMSTTTSSTTTMSTTTARPEACAVEPVYQYEPEAAAFGDVPYSHSEIVVKAADIVQSFNITLEFRTYYPTGLLLYLSNELQTEYVAIQTVDGKIMASYSDGAITNLEDETQERVDDGKWHKVTLLKQEKNILFRVDAGLDIVGRIARKVDIIAPVYVGGLPRGFNMRKGLVQESLKGCIRIFRLNEKPVDLIKNAAIMGVSRCTTSYEKGVYFSGSSYAIYDDKYTVGSAFLVKFDFRTTIRDGVLLTISHEFRRPAMALHMYDGQLIFSVNSDDFYVVETFYDDFYLCDNSWHSVRAELDKNTLILTVDNDEPIMDSQGTTKFLNTQHALFIGGYPYYADPQGATYGDEKFQGCIRNMEINGAPVDWAGSVQTVDVKIGYCPK